MTIRKAVAGQLIRLARKLDPNCCMDRMAVTATIETGKRIAAQLEQLVRDAGAPLIRSMSPLEFDKDATPRLILIRQRIADIICRELDEHGYEDDDEKRGQVAHHFASVLALEFDKGAIDNAMDARTVHRHEGG